MSHREEKTLFCYCHVGGKLVVNQDKSVTYEGGKVDGLVIDQNTTYDEFIAQICDRLQITICHKVFHYSLKFDKSCMLPLKDQFALNNLLSFNDGAGCVYVDSEEVDALAVPSPRCSNIDNQSVSDRSAEVEHVNRDIVPVEDYISIERPPPTLDDWNEEILGEGQGFQSADAFRESLYKYALAKGFRYKFIKNSGDRFIVRCAVDGCPWKLTARRMKHSDTLRLRLFIDLHKHPEDYDFKQKPVYRTKLAAALIKEKLKSSPNCLPRVICQDLQNEHDLTLTYHQAYCVKEVVRDAIYGKVGDSYRLIPWMCERVMDLMPGTVATWKAGEDSRFKQIFVAYNCSIRGFQLGCRPLLFIDDYYIRRPYRGTLLSVTALDANEEAFPIAYAVINSDTIDWFWFLEKLRSLVGERECVIVCRKNDAMLKELFELFGSETYSYCYRHLKEDFISYAVELQLGQNGKENAVAILDAIMHARRRSDYEKALEMMHHFNPTLYEWMLTSRPDQWANSQFRRRRWDKFASDSSESFNCWMLNECQSPLLEFMNKHREKLAEIVSERQNDVDTWIGPVGPKIEFKLRENVFKAQGLVLSRVSGSVFEFESEGANVVVDLAKRLCSCCEWQMTGIPCSHVCGAVQWANLDVYEFFERCYFKDCQQMIYAELMHVVPTDDMAEVIAHVGENGSFPLLPPATKPPPGRPPKLVNPQSDRKRTVRCSVCNEVGHTRRKCKKLVTEI